MTVYKDTITNGRIWKTLQAGDTWEVTSNSGSNVGNGGFSFGQTGSMDLTMTLVNDAGSLFPMADGSPQKGVINQVSAHEVYSTNPSPKNPAFTVAVPTNTNVTAVLTVGTGDNEFDGFVDVSQPSAADTGHHPKSGR